MLQPSVLPTRALLYGKDEPLPEQVPLRAGPLSLLYEAGDLRYIKFGEHEVVRRIYAAVRDRNWGTVAGKLSDVQMQIREHSFRIAYLSEHKERDIDFVWRAEITGEVEGTICFTFDGQARSTFLKNRIGFCVLHPICECAGELGRVEHRAAGPRLP
jgi:hypothetical protein